MTSTEHDDHQQLVIYTSDPAALEQIKLVLAQHALQVEAHNVTQAGQEGRFVIVLSVRDYTADAIWKIIQDSCPRSDLRRRQQ